MFKQNKVMFKLSKSKYENISSNVINLIQKWKILNSKIKYVKATLNTFEKPKSIKYKKIIIRNNIPMYVTSNITSISFSI